MNTSRLEDASKHLFIQGNHGELQFINFDDKKNIATKKPNNQLDVFEKNACLPPRAFLRARC